MKYFFFLSISMFDALSCSIEKDAQLNGAYGIFSVIEDNTVEMAGEIGSSTLENFNDLIAA